MGSSRANARVPDRYQKFIDGEISVKDLDDEELRRGQMRDKLGGFSGRPPLAIPREMHKEIVREILDRAQGRLNGMVNLAIDTLVEVAGNKRAPAVARNQAATYLMERAMGKVPDKVIQELAVKKFELDLDEILETGEDDGS